MRRNRNARIVATIGPATNQPNQIEALLCQGVDLFRLNFSHGHHDDHRLVANFIRSLESKYHCPVSILADLQGPKLRVGVFEKGSATLESGQAFRLDLKDTAGDQSRVKLPHPEILSAIDVGEELLLDDGKLRLVVTACTETYIDTKVLVGGTLSDRKGVNVPGTVLPISPITDKDHKDLAFALDLGVDWVALSFVQKPEDLAEAKKLIAGRAALMCKLEKPSAIHHLDEIIELSDGVMVARGDLGVELPPEEVPGIQKRIIRAGRDLGRPVIVATQMLESMIDNPTPTRAEASDVATAVYDGADGMMLSAETAVGKYPLDAVSIMDRIISRVEQEDSYRNLMYANHPSLERTSADAITRAASQVAETIGAACIVTFSMSGSTSKRASRERPKVPILALTPHRHIARQLNILWGVHNQITDDAENVADMVKKATYLAQKVGFAKKGDRIVITAGVPFGTPGMTNMLRIHWIE